MANMATQMECTKKGELYDFLQNLVARDNQPDCSLKPTQAPAVDSQPDSGLKPFPAPDQTTRMYTNIPVNHWQIFTPPAINKGE